MAKIRDEDADEPLERPVLVTREATMVPISIMATAPGQNCRFMGAGPRI